jgi:hypothetical protein
MMPASFAMLLNSFPSVCSLTVGHKEEDIRVKMNFDHLNELLDNCFEAMRVHKVHAGKFIVEMGNLVVTVERSGDPN